MSGDYNIHEFVNITLKWNVYDKALGNKGVM